MSFFSLLIPFTIKIFPRSVMKFTFYVAVFLALLQVPLGSYGQDIWLEAECGEQGANWIELNDNSASDGKALTSNTASIDAPPSSDAGVMSMYFNVDEPGDYTGFGRTISPNGSSNSFWVSVNGGSWINWNDIPSAVDAGKDANGNLPVIPGAVGYGITTKAGRGGKVYRVTNLNDKGAGSLRACIDAEGSRVCVFEVGGFIDLATPLKIKNPNITIAGQTAPSPGIVVGGGAGLMIQTQNVLVQHIGVRPGDERGYRYENRDALQIIGIEASNPATNIVLDHCTFAWGIDGTMDIARYVGNVTVRNCIIAETLNDSKHPKGEHSFASALYDWSGKAKVAIIGSYYAHNYSRQALTRVKNLFYANNLHYDREHRFTNISNREEEDKGGYATYNTLIGNVYIEGPSLRSDIKPVHIDTKELKNGTRIFLRDNYWSKREINNHKDLIENYKSSLIQNNPTSWVEGDWKTDRQEIIDYVINNVGPRPASRNEADLRLINNFNNRQGKLVDCISGCTRSAGGWPNLPSKNRKLSIPSNPNGDNDGDGYTNLEEWLHGFSGDVEREPLPSGYGWSVIRDSDAKKDAVFNLKSGLNELKFAVREKGVTLDKIYLTKTTNTPSGFGQKGDNCFQDVVNTPPTFKLSSSSITLPGNFEGTRAVQSIPDAVPAQESVQKPTYSISPDPKSVSFVSISIDKNSGEVKLVSKPGEYGNGTFTVTANDKQNANNIATKKLEVIVSKPKAPSLNSASAFPLRINSGGLEYSTKNSEIYLADIFSTGTTSPASTSGDISGTSDDLLYQNFRKGDDFSYVIPLENGTYKVVLTFAEPQFNSEGSRIFDISLEGKKRIDNLDIYKAVGFRNILRRTFRNIEVNDGKLNIDFLANKDKAIVNAIEVSLENTPPVFNIDQKSISVEQNFARTENVVVTPVAPPSLEENQKVTYTISPTSNAIANATIDAETGFVTITSIEGKSGKQTFTITADDGQSENNTYKQTFSLDIFETPGAAYVDEFPLRINTGGESFTAANGNLFSTDSYYVGTSSPTVSSKSISGTQDETLYQSYRWGPSFGYHIPIQNGSYDVILHFAEVFLTSEGERAFDVSIENVSKLNDFDILKEVGQLSATRKVFKGIKVTDGVLEIDFASSTQKEAIVSGIEVIVQTVSAPNNPPAFTLQSEVITLDEDFGTFEQAGPSLSTPTKGEENQTITFSVTPINNPLVGAQIDPKTGKLTLTSINNISGEQTFTLVADDGQVDNNFFAKSFKVKVNPVNDPPSFSLSNQIVNLPQGFTGARSIEAFKEIPPSDEINQKVFYSISPKSSSLVGVSFDQATGNVTLSSLGSRIGSESFVITANDGQAENNLASVTLTVNIYPPDEIRINCGGPEITLADGTKFDADKFYRKETQTNVSSVEIFDTDSDGLYQSERFGQNFRYEIPVGNGSYDLVLHFAELHHTELDQRVFDVYVENNQKELKAFDISAFVNPKTAKTVILQDISVNDNHLSIDFNSIVGNGQVCAIEVVTSGSISSSLNVPPVFSIKQEINTVENFSEVITVKPTLEDEEVIRSAQNVMYSIEPAISELANIDIDPLTGNISIASLEGKKGSERFIITADDGQAKNNIYRKALSLNIAPAGTSLQPERIDPIRINAGGASFINQIGEVFMADTYHGNTGNAVSDTEVPLGRGIEMFMTSRTGDDIVYNVPVPNGPYQVVFHFIELEHNAKGKRIMEAYIEKEQVLRNFDVFAKSGFRNTTSRTFDNVIVEDEILTVGVKAVKGKAKLCALEIIGMHLRDTRPSLRINCGTESKSSFGGQIFTADKQFFSKNTKGYIKSKDIDVDKTSYNELYRTGRITHEFLDPFSYKIPVEDGKYFLYLHFADLHFDEDTKDNGEKQRVFDVEIEGKKEIVDLDLIADVGANTALIKRIEVNIEDGYLDLNFLPTVHKASICAIELLIPAEEHTALIFNQNSQNSFTDLDDENSGLDELKLTLFPNPTENDVKLLIQGEYNGPVNVVIYDAVGKTVKTFNFDKDSYVDKYLVRLRDLAKGIYIIESHLGQDVKLLKVLKQ